MPRQIAGWKHDGHFTDGYELFKSVKLLVGLYGKENVKTHEADVYLREGAKQIAEVSGMFGSSMTFKDNGTGALSGDRIRVMRLAT
jgi:hypothetical protein